MLAIILRLRLSRLSVVNSHVNNKHLSIRFTLAAPDTGKFCHTNSDKKGLNYDAAN